MMDAIQLEHILVDDKEHICFMNNGHMILVANNACNIVHIKEVN